MKGERGRQLLGAALLGCLLFALLTQAEARLNPRSFKRAGNFVRASVRAEKVTPLQRPHHHRRRWRHRRAVAVAPAFDENGEIVPDLDFGEKNFGDRFAELWQSMVTSIRDCFSAIGRIFTDNNNNDGSVDYYDYYNEAAQ